MKTSTWKLKRKGRRYLSMLMVNGQAYTTWPVLNIFLNVHKALQGSLMLFQDRDLSSCVQQEAHELYRGKNGARGLHPND